MRKLTIFAAAFSLAALTATSFASSDNLDSVSITDDESCSFLKDGGTPAHPNHDDYPTRQEFMKCMDTLISPYTKLEEEIRDARQIRNTEVRASLEQAAEKMQTYADKVEQEAIEDHKNKNGGIIDEQTASEIKASIMAELFPIALILGLSMPDENARLGGCVAPYSTLRMLENALNTRPDFKLNDEVLFIVARDLEQCSKGIVSRIDRDLEKNSETNDRSTEDEEIMLDGEVLLGQAKGYTSYINDPYRVKAEAESLAEQFSRIMNLAEKRWCTFFVNDPDNPKHYKHLSEENAPKRKTYNYERCEPYLLPKS